MNAAPDSAPAPEPGFGIYVHWPFCLSKCPYCDFNSHVSDHVDHGRWRAALLAELDHFAALTPGRRVTSLFFGGGTPSLMEPETAAAVIERVRSLWPTEEGIEITLEANPTSVEAGRFAALASAGVGRVSLGVQALDDAALRFLGRQHGAGEALAAVALARRHFPRWSFDLIYARPGQTPDAWRDELRRALEHAGDHLSVYQLTIEPGTAFHARFRRGELVLPDEDAAGQMYEETQALLAEAGLPAYEISNHARPGGECRHNLTYWRGGDWVGVGPGAHGRLTLPAGRVATRQARAPQAWLAEVERAGHATRETTSIDPDEAGEELVMMGLRLAEGIHRETYRRTTGRDLEAAFDPAQIEALVGEGLMVFDATGLRATAAGRQRLDAVLRHLLA